MLSKRLNVRLLINYIASWQQNMDKEKYLKTLRREEMKTRDMNDVWCIKYGDHRVLERISTIKRDV